MTSRLTHLAELDTHLVVRVDTPDRALDVDLVLVHGDESSEGAGGELLEHDAVGGLVALEDLGLDESLVGCSRAELVPDLLLRLAEREGPGACQHGASQTVRGASNKAGHRRAE
jgi:hypothetical protein